MGALTGIRVCDFSWGLAGPVAAELLALNGAEVIKVESLARLDFSRLFINPVTRKNPGINRSPAFNDSNLNKLSVQLNLRQPGGLDLAKRLIRICDVMVEGFTPGVIQRLGLGYEVVKGIRPDIIMFSTSGNGGAGPEARSVGYAPLFGALGGVGHLTGYPDRPPSEIRVTMDATSAYTGAFAIMAALVHRRRTGKGQHIDFSSREAITCLIGDSIMDYTMNRRVQSRRGNEDEIMAPHNCYPCRGKDEWVSIAIGNDAEWHSFRRAMDDPDWAREDRFSDQLKRWQNREALDGLVGKWTASHGSFEIMDILQKAGVAAAPSYTAKDIYCDQHLNERGLITQVEHPELGVRCTFNCPWKLSATPPEIRHDGPLVGQHNDYVYGDLLGLSRKEIEDLAASGVIY
ncbi:MAG: CoA transferase [Chloroflexi bacterium]|nr:CoA transferase [Chloroflexota bacterium]